MKLFEWLRGCKKAEAKVEEVKQPIIKNGKRCRAVNSNDPCVGDLLSTGDRVLGITKFRHSGWLHVTLTGYSATNISYNTVVYVVDESRP